MVKTVFSSKAIIPRITICSGRNKLLKWQVGDFNGDKKHDVICADVNGNVILGFSDHQGNILNVKWQGLITECRNKYVLILSADMNGDGLDDFVCIIAHEVKLFVRLSPFSSSRKKEPDISIKLKERCIARSIYLIDLNADNKADVFCKSAYTGEYMVTWNDFKFK